MIQYDENSFWDVLARLVQMDGEDISVAQSKYWDETEGGINL